MPFQSPIQDPTQVNLTVQPAPVTVQVDPTPVTVQPAGAAIQNNVTATIPADLSTTNSYGARVFGNGSDGDVTISTGTVTLTRDMQYASLTIAAGATLRTAGFKVAVAGTLNNNGTIDNSAQGSIPGLTGTFGGGGACGTGSNTPGSAPPNATSPGWFSGGNGGAVGTIAGGQGAPLAPLVVADTANLSARSYTGGGGGANNGGGGGGGVVALMAAAITNTGTISARGGDYSGSTRGGGGGGVVLLVYKTFTGSSPIVLGGAGAAAGQAGYIGEVILK